MEVCGIFDSNIRISPWKNATKSWQLCFPFVPPFSYSLSLSFLSLTEYFRNEISPEAISYMKETVHCAKKALGSGADDTEGSMIVRENVYEEEK